MADNWEEWEIEQAAEIKAGIEHVIDGHTGHCACRFVWGDGECSCSKEIKDLNA